MGLLKAIGAASGRPGYEKALSELASPQGQQLSVVAKSGLPAALKAFANDIADLFSGQKKDGKGSSPKTAAGPAQKPRGRSKNEKETKQPAPADVA
jgi:hypothetical protein